MFLLKPSSADLLHYDFTAPMTFDKLFTGIAAPRAAWLPIGGVPIHIGVTDLLDDDYGPCSSGQLTV
jgi:hypothetical protein